MYPRRAPATTRSRTGTRGHGLAFDRSWTARDPGLPDVRRHAAQPPIPARDVRRRPLLGVWLSIPLATLDRGVDARGLPVGRLLRRWGGRLRQLRRAGAGAAGRPSGAWWPTWSRRASPAATSSRSVAGTDSCWRRPDRPFEAAAEPSSLTRPHRPHVLAGSTSSPGGSKRCRPGVASIASSRRTSSSMSTTLAGSSGPSSSSSGRAGPCCSARRTWAACGAGRCGRGGRRSRSPSTSSTSTARRSPGC